MRGYALSLHRDVQQVLEEVAEVAQVLGVALPGPAGIVARIIGAAMALGVELARAGKDPEIEIKRILASDPYLDEVHAEWDRVIAAKFPDRSTYSQHSLPSIDAKADTVPAGDPYDGDGT